MLNHGDSSKRAKIFFQPGLSLTMIRMIMIRMISMTVRIIMIVRMMLTHMGPEGVRNRKKTPIFFVDAKFLQIARGFQKCES